MPYILSFRFYGHYSTPITVESFIGTSSRKISCCWQTERLKSWTSELPSLHGKRAWLQLIRQSERYTTSVRSRQEGTWRMKRAIFIPLVSCFMRCWPDKNRLIPIIRFPLPWCISRIFQFGREILTRIFLPVWKKSSCMRWKKMRKTAIRLPPIWFGILKPSSRTTKLFSAITVCRWYSSEQRRAVECNTVCRRNSRLHRCSHSSNQNICRKNRMRMKMTMMNRMIMMNQSQNKSHWLFRFWQPSQWSSLLWQQSLLLPCWPIQTCCGSPWKCRIWLVWPMMMPLRTMIKTLCSVLKKKITTMTMQLVRFIIRVKTLEQELTEATTTKFELRLQSARGHRWFLFRKSRAILKQKQRICWPIWASKYTRFKRQVALMMALKREIVSEPTRHMVQNWRLAATLICMSARGLPLMKSPFRSLSAWHRQMQKRNVQESTWRLQAWKKSIPISHRVKS